MAASLIIILLLLGCIAIVGIVLIQNPKGGGLGTSVGGLNNNMFGVKRTTDFLERATWGFGIAILSLCLLTSMLKPRTNSKSVEKRIETPLDQLLRKSNPTSVPK